MEPNQFSQLVYLIKNIFLELGQNKTKIKIFQEKFFIFYDRFCHIYVLYFSWEEIDG